MKHTVLLFFVWILVRSGYAQPDTLRVLFIGNSYTYVNNLPQLTADLSVSAGKTLLFDSSTPGGYSYGMHAGDATTLAKIRQGGWDAVVLQEQSQLPTIDYYRYNEMYPGAQLLCDSIRTYSPCADIITFMTWGRRFGGQQCINGYCSPSFSDFNHMQDSLRSAYLEVSENNRLKCAPVGMAWRKALEDTAVVLHATDNSHPALNGSYLAAAVMFASIWQQSPISVSYSAGITPTLAARFREIADSIVFHDSTDWNRSNTTFSPGIACALSLDSACFQIVGSLPYGSSIDWDFGDAVHDSTPSPCHVYTTPGTYTVVLTVSHCGVMVDTTLQVTVLLTAVPESVARDGSKLNMVLVNDRLTLRTSGGGDDMPFSIFDISGKEKANGVISGGETMVDLQGWPTGMFFIATKNDRIRFVR